jgi:hypothetical protein
LKANRSMLAAPVIPVLAVIIGDVRGERRPPRPGEETHAGHRWIFSETLRDADPQEWMAP